jgi:hypothetical protein
MRADPRTQTVPTDLTMSATLAARRGRQHQCDSSFRHPLEDLQRTTTAFKLE